MAERTRILKVGIYRVVCYSAEAVTLDRIVQKIDGLPRDESRAAKLIDDPIRPRDDIRITSQYCLVDFNRIRNTDRMLTGNVHGEEGVVRFRRLQPTSRTAVLLDHHSNTMYIQEGWGSADIGHITLGRYLKAAGNLQDVRVEVILNDLDALERLRDKRHRSFKVSIAGIENAEALRAQGHGDEAILDILRAFKSPNALISVGLDPNKDGQLENVYETSAALLAWNSLKAIFGKKRPVKYAQVVAEGENGEEEIVVNLLKDRLLHKERLELDGTEPTDAERYRAVVKAFERYSPDLRRRFPPSAKAALQVI